MESISPLGNKGKEATE